ncbi:hypothetical protein [Vibrio gallaecicus]|nr:hypothetical protein [Vibrio gallaecicus]MDN3616458.1 hypothetical protein [Vibrio gallaecicus]
MYIYLNIKVIMVADSRENLSDGTCDTFEILTGKDQCFSNIG